MREILPLTPPGPPHNDYATLGIALRALERSKRKREQFRDKFLADNIFESAQSSPASRNGRARPRAPLVDATRWRHMRRSRIDPEAPQKRAQTAINIHSLGFPRQSPCRPVYEEFAWHCEKIGRPCSQWHYSAAFVVEKSMWPRGQPNLRYKTVISRVACLVGSNLELHTDERVAAENNCDQAPCAIVESNNGH